MERQNSSDNYFGEEYDKTSELEVLEKIQSNF